MLRGLGHASYIEACGGGGPENAWITLEKDGNVTVKVGTQTNGQGHLTAYAQLVSQYLDLPLDKITVLQGDTAVVPSGSAPAVRARCRWWRGGGHRHPHAC